MRDHEALPVSPESWDVLARLPSGTVVYIGAYFDEFIDSLDPSNWRDLPSFVMPGGGVVAVAPVASPLGTALNVLDPGELVQLVATVDHDGPPLVDGQVVQLMNGLLTQAPRRPLERIFGVVTCVVDDGSQVDLLSGGVTHQVVAPKMTVLPVPGHVAVLDGRFLRVDREISVVVNSTLTTEGELDVVREFAADDLVALRAATVEWDGDFEGLVAFVSRLGDS